MINLKLGPGEFQGDIQPTATSPVFEGGPAITFSHGNAVYSPGGTFRLVFQSDGNAVVQAIDDSRLPRDWKQGQAVDPNALTWSAPIWASGTNAPGVVAMCMQYDGNLVIYGEEPERGAGRQGYAPWASGTNGNQGAFLRMQDDGNLVIYSQSGAALWSSGTQAGGH